MGEKHFFASLSIVRKALDFTVEECGAALGLKGRTYYLIERGEQRPYADQLLKLADLFDIDPRMLARALTFTERVELLTRGEKRREQRERAKAEGRTLADVIGEERNLAWLYDDAAEPAPAPRSTRARASTPKADRPKYKPHQAPQPRDAEQGQEWKWRAYASLPPVDDGEEQYRVKMRAAGNWMPNEQAAALAKSGLDLMREGAPPPAQDEALTLLAAEWQDPPAIVGDPIFDPENYNEPDDDEPE